MFYDVFMHLAMLASHHVMVYDHIVDISSDVVMVVVESDDVFISKEKDAMLLGEWVGREVAGRPHLIGDNGTSFGDMQIKATWFKLCQTDAKTLVSDRRANITCGYTIMKHLKGVCGGSVRGALRAYASGTCQGSIEVRQKVEARCKSSGAC